MAKPKREGEPMATKTGELQGMATLTLLGHCPIVYGVRSNYLVPSIDAADDRPGRKRGRRIRRRQATKSTRPNEVIRRG